MDRLLIDQKLETLARMGVIDDTTATNLRRTVGFRNIALRNYEKVDWDIVHVTCKIRHLAAFSCQLSGVGNDWRSR